MKIVIGIVILIYFIYLMYVGIFHEKITTLDTWKILAPILALILTLIAWLLILIILALLLK